MQSVLQYDENEESTNNQNECNFDDISATYDDKQDTEEFSVEALGPIEEQKILESNPYCFHWRKKSGIHLAKPQLIARSFAHKKGLGLFSLFLNESFMECVRKWTSAELIRRGKRTKSLRMDQLQAYFGLELATSLHKLNRLRDYWSKSDLLGIPFFKKTMSRDMFLEIRAALRLYPSYDADVALEDPLWHSRQILQHFARNAASLAVPVGVSSLDENTIRCKGQTTARSYMKSKPVRFGIRFYAVVGWAHAYLHSFQDNGSGNRTGLTLVERYKSLFRELRGAVDRKIDGTLVGKGKPTALWCAQMAHQTHMHPVPGVGRLMVMDNFYTRHALARQLCSLSDKECKVLGTVRFTNVDGVNRPLVKEAIESVKHANRGEWRLVQVLENEKGANSTVSIAEKTGFIVFKDRTVITFYCNDLSDTPTLPIHTPDEHATKCVHGLAPLMQWTGNESMTRTTLQVPSLIVAYNLFMNGVDRFDQFRSTAATMRKERRVTMSILTFVLDASILNAHALLHAISKAGDTIIDINLMKRRIVLQLVAEHNEYCQQRASLSAPRLTTTSSNNAPDSHSSSVSTQHFLLENEGRKSVHCVVCNLLVKQGRGGYTMYSCNICRRGFHVNCFTFYHHKDAFRCHRPDVYRAMTDVQRAQISKHRRHRPNKVASTISNARLLC